jgi:ABC-type spermidine/putrescine transport system permease subunit II
MSAGDVALRAGLWLAWAGVALAIAFLYLPLIPPAIEAFSGLDPEGGPFQHFAAMLEDARLMKAARLSLIVGLLVAVLTPLLALVAAEAIRAWRVPRLVLAIGLVPLFVPGISMGLATALFFQALGVPPSLWSIVAVQVIWAFPFALLLVVTAMAGFEPVYLEAAYMSGASRFRAFLEVELPQIGQGLIGAALFSLILSFNETIRTSVVQGGRNTVQTYLWAQYQQVGLSPEQYALMTVLILGTVVLMALLAAVALRAARRG